MVRYWWDWGRVCPNKHRGKKGWQVGRLGIAVSLHSVHVQGFFWCFISEPLYVYEILKSLTSEPKCMHRQH